MIYPVLQKIPENGSTALSRKDKARALSRYARQSALASACKSNLPAPEFLKDPKGVPVPGKGVFWSVSHKEGMVGGIVHTAPVGIDIERFRPVSRHLFDRIVSNDEAQLFGDVSEEEIFFRVFTAKEAALKKNGKGIESLSKVSISQVADPKNLTAVFQGENIGIEHFGVDGYLAAVTKDQCETIWTLGSI